MLSPQTSDSDLPHPRSKAVLSVEGPRTAVVEPLCKLEPILVFLCRNKHGTIYVETPFRRDIMALNLTRTVATQAVRTFTHQTWVSGDLRSLCHSFWINISNPSLALLQAPLALESHSRRSVHTGFSSLPECSQVGF